MRFTIETAQIGQTYMKLNSINLKTEALQKGFLAGSPVTVKASNRGGDDETYEIEATGTLGQTGVLSGMAAIYSELMLAIGDKLVLECDVSNGIQVAKVTSIVGQDGNARTPEPAPPGDQRVDPAVAQPDPTADTVMSRFRAKHMHFAKYQPELWDHWLPSTEVDVYLVFGAHQKYTRYEYCCGVTVTILRQLNLDHLYGTQPDGFREGTPDALFIDTVTKEYLIAEFKINSRDFTLNHTRPKIDVLVCWTDDMPADSRHLLPERIVVLRDIAREAGEVS